MKTRIFLIAGLTLTAICLPSFALAGLPEAVNYLKSQTPDAWVTQGLIAAGEANPPLGHLSSVTEGEFNPANDYAKTILALAAAGENPSTFGNVDYVAKLKSYFNNDQMGDVNLLNDDIWSILAFASIKKADSVEAAASKNYLLSHQNADGGWGYDLTGGSDTNDTAAAVMALAETGAGASDPAVAKALSYLQSLQNADGGFPYNPAWGGDSDSGSDAWIICVLNKFKQDPASWNKDGVDAVANLESLQDEDGGYWWMDPAGEPIFNNKAMTPYATVALAGKSFPIGYYKIPEPTRLSVNKSALNSDETAIITVEYFNDQAWLPLAGAAIEGLPQNYTTDAAGQASVSLPVGDYSLLAVKEGFISSQAVKISVSAPEPAPITNPSPGSGSGGSVIFIVPPTYCQNVEYDVWQNTCADNWQYRNVLSITPVNCTLTAEQEDQRKRACVKIEAEEKNDENSSEIQPEVLGIKIDSSSVEQLDRIAMEANGIVGGQTGNFVAEGTDSTITLGAGERAGVLNSFKSAFGKTPEIQADWEEVIRISNNQLPLATSLTAEKKASLEFKKVYQREADLKNSNDQTAINLIAYGLRPDRRDLDSERAGIRVFVRIYKYLPVSAFDWDTVRAIAYSGVGK